MTNHTETSDSYTVDGSAVRVSFVELGEGLSGEYNEADPGDVELLRFDVATIVDGEWETVDDGSYCTNVPAAATAEQRQSILAFVHSQLGEAPRKRVMEALSWVGLSADGTPDTEQALKLIENFT